MENCIIHMPYSINVLPNEGGLGGSPHCQDAKRISFNDIVQSAISKYVKKLLEEFSE